MQAQIAVLVGVEEEREEGKKSRERQVKMIRLLLFNREASQVAGFVIACKLYIRMRIRKKEVKEQVQWVLIYV